MNTRQTCGTTSPTNAIGPQAAVAAPMSRVIAAMPTQRVAARFAPSAVATSSPSDSRFNPGVLTSANTRPAQRNGATCATTSPSRPASEPTAQNRNASRVRVSSSTSADVNAPSRALTATPASASVTGVGPSGLTAPRRKTATPAASAPAKANQT